MSFLFGISVLSVLQTDSYTIATRLYTSSALSFVSWCETELGTTHVFFLSFLTTLGTYSRDLSTFSRSFSFAWATTSHVTARPLVGWCQLTIFRWNGVLFANARPTGSRTSHVVYLSSNEHRQAGPSMFPCSSRGVLS